MSFVVTFGSTTLTGVKSVAPGVTLSPDRVDNGSNYYSEARREINVNGFLFVKNHGGTRSGALAALKSFEDSLRAEGTASLTVPGYGTFNDSRVTSITISEFANGPVVEYKIVFTTKATNIHTDTTTELSGDNYTLTFNLLPEIQDSWDRQDPNIAISSQTLSKKRRWTIRGIFGGSAAELATFRALVESTVADTNLQLTVSTGTYSVKAVNCQVTSPPVTSIDSSLEFEINVESEEDFSLENHYLAHSGGTFAGVAFDVITGYSHNISFVKSGGSFLINSESLSVSGDIWFSTFAAAESYQANFRTALESALMYSSGTGKTLVVTSQNYSEPKRDGRNTDGTQRYVLSGSLSLNWVLDEDDTSVSNSETLFGIIWDHITSKSYGGNLDAVGNKTSDTLNVSGKTTTLPTVNVGNFDGTYYLTNLSIEGREPDGRYKVTASGRTLDTVELRQAFIADTFAGLLFFNEISSHQRSATWRYQALDGGYNQTAFTETVSGFIHLSGAGSDVRNTVLPLVQNTAAQIVGLSNLRLTSVSVGQRESFLDKSDGQYKWRQSVSLSGTRNYVPDASSGGGGGYEIVEESNFTIEQITNQYNQITIPGGSLIFKKTGLRPGKVTKTNTRRRVGGSAKDAITAPPEPDSSGLGGLEVIDEGVKRSTSSTTKSVTRSWVILDGTVPTNLPTTFGT